MTVEFLFTHIPQNEEKKLMTLNLVKNFIFHPSFLFKSLNILTLHPGMARERVAWRSIQRATASQFWLIRGPGKYEINNNAFSFSN